MAKAILSFFTGSAALGARYFRGMLVTSGLSLLLAFALMLWVSFGNSAGHLCKCRRFNGRNTCGKESSFRRLRDSNAALKGLEPLLHDPRVLGVVSARQSGSCPGRTPFPQREVLFQPNVREHASASRFSVRRIISSGDENVGQVILDIELGSLRTHEQYIVGAFGRGLPLLRASRSRPGSSNRSCGSRSYGRTGQVRSARLGIRATIICVPRLRGHSRLPP